MNKTLLKMSDEVLWALQQGKSVVALESTIISHGMPYPENVKTALKVEQTVRQCGAIPATIAVMDGKIKVGLSEGEIELLGKTGTDAIKCSRRDLGYVLSAHKVGATTVAATMIGAAMAGIRVFATGGIGGVHRGAEKTMDISADLEELAQTPVAVVCAGCKSILDIGLTLEYLETKGVAVVGLNTDEMPAFYTKKSGFKTLYNLNEVQCAKFIKTQQDLGFHTGMIIANPIPDQYSMDEHLINAAIEQALRECEEQNIRGKETTPFLLAKVKELTGGESLKSNIALVLHNAQKAAVIANELCKL